MRHYSTTLIASVLALFSVSNASASSCSEPPIDRDDGTLARSWVDFIVSLAPSRYDALFVGHLSETDKGPAADRPEYRWILDMNAKQASLGILGHSDIRVFEAYHFTGTVMFENERLKVSDLSVTLVVNCSADRVAECTQPLPAGNEIIFTGIYHSKSSGTTVSPGLCYPYFEGEQFRNRFFLEQLASAFRERPV